MIRGLRGKVFKTTDDSVLVETPGGVIYGVKVPYTFLAKLREGDEIFIHTYTHYSQNGVELYGFESEEHMKIFTILLEIPGIGPSMGIRILSDISVEELLESVRSGNVSVLKRVKGLGTKKAEIIIFSLRDVMWDHALSESEGYINQSLQALVSLGVDYPEAKRLVSEAVKSGLKTPEEIIKFALRQKEQS